MANLCRSARWPQRSAGASAQFDASALAPGVYSLRLTSANGQVVKRVVIK
ncbi:MAG: T9SS type A sorting domain-containing protein [Hymenobacter sp.]